MAEQIDMQQLSPEQLQAILNSFRANNDSDEQNYENSTSFLYLFSRCFCFLFNNIFINSNFLIHKNFKIADIVSSQLETTFQFQSKQNKKQKNSSNRKNLIRAKMEIKYRIRCSEKNRFARTNSISGN